MNDYNPPWFIYRSTWGPPGHYLSWKLDYTLNMIGGRCECGAKLGPWEGHDSYEAVARAFRAHIENEGIEIAPEQWRGVP